MNDMTSNPLLITGATGGIGREVVRLLHEAGAPVRAMCRRQQQIDDFAKAGIDAVLGDLDEPESVVEAMRGASRVFLLTFPGQKQLEHGKTGIAAAARAGVRHVVHLGAADADITSPVPWAKAPALTDLELRRSSMDWTLIRPSAFMQNLLGSAGQIKRGFLPQTSGRGRVGWIDTDDIARVAAHVLTTDGHAGHDYVLTGPEALSMRDVASRASAVLAHPVRYVHIPGPIFRYVLRLGGLDDWTAKGLEQQFATIVRHERDNVSHTTDLVGTLTGTPARNLTSFITANRKAFE
jgi:uncharacterized protein YbjT (DUF2867 family)